MVELERKQKYSIFFDDIFDIKKIDSSSNSIIPISNIIPLPIY